MSKKSIKRALDQIKKKRATALVQETKYDETFPHVPTGSVIVDRIIGPIRGFPVGMTEVFSEEGVGKTSLAISASIECQKRGGKVLYVDFERRVNLQYAARMGLDIEGINTPDGSLFLVQPTTLEEGWEMLDTMIASGEVDFIVVDSIASTYTEKELKADVDKSDKVVAHRARVLGRVIPQTHDALVESNIAMLLINQTRQNVGARWWEDPMTQPGGKAPKFYSSVRLLLKSGKKLKAEDVNELTGKEEKIVRGAFVRVTAVKNNVGPPFRTGEYLWRYGVGIDNAYTLVEVGRRKGVITSSGRTHRIDDIDWEFSGILADLRSAVAQEPEVLEYLETHLNPAESQEAKDFDEEVEEDPADGTISMEDL